MTNLRIGLFIFQIRFFGFLEGVLNSYNSEKIRQQQREIYYAYCCSVQRFESDHIEIGVYVVNKMFGGSL